MFFLKNILFIIFLTITTQSFQPQCYSMKRYQKLKQTITLRNLRLKIVKKNIENLCSDIFKIIQNESKTQLSPDKIKQLYEEKIKKIQTYISFLKTDKIDPLCLEKSVENNCYSLFMILLPVSILDENITNKMLEEAQNQINTINEEINKINEINNNRESSLLLLNKKNIWRRKEAWAILKRLIIFKKATNAGY